MVGDNYLRRTAATMMQALGLSPEVIDRCPNHVLKGSRVRRHHLQREHADEKRAVWRLLGEETEKFLGSAAPALAPRPPAVCLPLKSQTVRHATSA